MGGNGASGCKKKFCKNEKFKNQEKGKTSKNTNIRKMFVILIDGRETLAVGRYPGNKIKVMLMTKICAIENNYA